MVPFFVLREISIDASVKTSSKLDGSFDLASRWTRVTTLPGTGLQTSDMAVKERLIDVKMASGLVYFADSTHDFFRDQPLFLSLATAPRHP